VYEVRKGETVTLTKALATAGGPLPTAKGKHSKIIRQLADGTTEQIPVDIGKVLKGKAPDMVLADSDVVFVPGSTTKTIGRGFLGSINSVVTTIAIIGVRGY